MTSRKLYRNPNVRLGLWIGLVLLVAVPVYYVRQMLALLLIFAAFFFVATGIVFALYLISHAGQLSLAKAEPYALSAARAGRRGLGFVGDFSRKQFRRQNSETAP
ncbi:MAG: hypothetical protein ACLP1Y_10630 [Candidatus Acidiferrales bacterium]